MAVSIVLPILVRRQRAPREQPSTKLALPKEMTVIASGVRSQNPPPRHRGEPISCRSVHHEKGTASLSRDGIADTVR